MFVGVIGLIALAVAAMFGLGWVDNWWHEYNVRTRWPQVRATIKNCEVRQRERRKSVGGYYYRIECEATFMLNGKQERGGFTSRSATYEHRTGGSWAVPGIEELRAWVAQHPAGTVVVARSDPEWSQTLQLDPNPDIFATSSWHGLDAKIAGVAAVIGLALLALAAFVAR